MFSEIDFKNKKILDAMCGSGQVTEFLMKNECCVHALDISENQIYEYKKSTLKMNLKLIQFWKPTIKIIFLIML